jgi:hypothetical protein
MGTQMWRRWTEKPHSNVNPHFGGYAVKFQERGYLGKLSKQSEIDTDKLQYWGRMQESAVGRWFLTAAARLRAWVGSCGICGGQNDTGAGFLPVFRFLLPIFIPPVELQSPSIIQGWYNRLIVAAAPSGLSLTPLRIIIKTIRRKVICKF